MVKSAEILDAVNREEISQALDVLCQRFDSDNPGRKAKGRNLGESRGHRAGRQQKVPVNREEISQALDVLCQRILTIQAAKQKGGTWEKAEACCWSATESPWSAQDQSMKRRFRRSWYALSGASKERLGFSDFYGRTGHALVNVLNTHDSSLGLARFSAY